MYSDVSAKRVYCIKTSHSSSSVHTFMMSLNQVSLMKSLHRNKYIIFLFSCFVYLLTYLLKQASHLHTSPSWNYWGYRTITSCGTKLYYATGQAAASWLACYLQPCSFRLVMTWVQFAAFRSVSIYIFRLPIEPTVLRTWFYFVNYSACKSI